MRRMGAALAPSGSHPISDWGESALRRRARSGSAAVMRRRCGRHRRHCGRGRGCERRNRGECDAAGRRIVDRKRRRRPLDRKLRELRPRSRRDADVRGVRPEGRALGQGRRGRSRRERMEQDRREQRQRQRARDPASREEVEAEPPSHARVPIAPRRLVQRGRARPHSCDECQAMQMLGLFPHRAHAYSAAKP